jgi:hypothetical protein
VQGLAGKIGMSDSFSNKIATFLANLTAIHKLTKLIWIKLEIKMKIYA